MKTLREMYPNGVYTENSQEVFDWFEELLEGDYNYQDEVYYEHLNHVGLDDEFDLALKQYEATPYYQYADYLTNEEFMQITLEASESIAEATPTLSIGELVKQLQSSLSSSEVAIAVLKGNVILGCKVKGKHCEWEWDVSDKTGDEIEALYNALSLIVGEND